MAIAVAAATVPTTAQAQPCPNKPIKVVVESAAGTQNDIWARRYSERMAQSMQANIIVKTLAEFQQRAKANPGEFVCGNSGHAGFGHFACAMVERALGIKMLMAPYKGPVMVDLIAGHIQTSLGFSAELEPHVAPGKLTVLASFAPKRLPKFPNAPTFAEAGFPNMEMPGWNAFFMPAGAPKEAVDRFNAEVVKAMATRPEMVEWRTSVGGVYEAWTAEQFADFVRAEHIKWRRMSDDLGIKVAPLN